MLAARNDFFRLEIGMSRPSDLRTSTVADLSCVVILVYVAVHLHPIVRDRCAYNQYLSVSQLANEFKGESIRLSLFGRVEGFNVIVVARHPARIVPITPMSNNSEERYIYRYETHLGPAS